MVYKIKIFFLISFLLIPINSNSNIIYDKNNIIISTIDLNYYKQLYFENYGLELNESTAIKNIVIIKNIIKYFKKNNPNFLKKIDEVLIKEYGNEKMKIQIYKDFSRYFKIKNEFIYEFYQTKFDINHLKTIFNSLDKIELPISDNNCLTILGLKDLKYDIYFLNNFYENLKMESKKYETQINNVKYRVCIDSRTYKLFENEILNYIDSETSDDFKKFVYEQQQ